MDSSSGVALEERILLPFVVGEGASNSPFIRSPSYLEGGEASVSEFGRLVPSINEHGPQPHLTDNALLVGVMFSRVLIVNPQELKLLDFTMEPNGALGVCPPQSASVSQDPVE